MAFQALFKLLFLVLLWSSSATSDSSSLDFKSQCKKLPYPEPCEHFLGNNFNFVNQTSDFFNASVQLAIERAIHAQINTNTLNTKLTNRFEKTAWSDCVELYEYTVVKLKKTMNPNKNCSKDDMQTWFSTALTCVETCHAGFTDLGMSADDYPLLNNNLTKLISNILALNHVPFSEPSFTGDFPSWVKPGDRKLLQAPMPSSLWPSIAEAPSSMTPSPSPSPSPSPDIAPDAFVNTALPWIIPDIVVAQDGSGDYRTLTAAVSEAAWRQKDYQRLVIYVKAGVYRENVEIKSDNIMLVGDGIGKTIITGSRSVGGGYTTFQSATVAVVGEGFIARGITFRNTAGPEMHQAVALRCGSDLSVFYRCSFEGYQDTLYVHSERQFYKECDIFGTVDFIFGNAAVVFQNCNMYPRYPPNGTNTLTAQSRTDPNQNTGIIIHNCVVSASRQLMPFQDSVNTYLGRPWKEYSRTIVMKSFLDSLINPAGWLFWTGDFALDTLYYAEYANVGPGSSTDDRVAWKGYHVLTRPSQVMQYTVDRFLGGRYWLPATRVPFTPGL